MVDWLNKRTGEVEKVPDGIDPGWDTNPGAAREGATAAALSRAKQNFHETAANAIPMGAVWPTGTGGVFSTAKNVTQSGIEDVLTQVPGIADRLNLVQQFVAKRGIKAIFVTQQQMTARNRAAQKIARQVGDFLDKNWSDAPIRAFTTGAPKRTNGFTFAADSVRHLVVKVLASSDTRKMSPQALSRGVDKAISEYKAGSPAWSIRTATGLTDDGILATFAHELGHLVHSSLKSPEVPSGLPSLTLYGSQDRFEWHAEHFAAWLLNRDALAQWSPSVANHFDQIMNRAITATPRRQP
jgi:hypothetical protein